MTELARCCLSANDEGHLLDHAPQVFDLVWRFDFTEPGFAALELPAETDSHLLRSWMVALKRRLSEIAIRDGREPLAFKSMGRFNQQETTKFHLDGAPDRSFLMLGYEPSKIHGRLFLADYTRAAFDLGITPQAFLVDWNPMYRRGEEVLKPYVTELPRAGEGRARILLINNSSLPFSEARTNTLGVMHKAIVEAPDEGEQRIVNSTMLAAGADDELSDERQRDFVNTDRISQKV
ncbi:MAG TPA: hypothetical protein VF278_15350 [Pirellulales bacterium]